MLFFVRTDSGKGNATIYARLKNLTGQYWDFTAQSWVGTINANCKVYLVEYADGDPLESLYMQQADIPAGGPWIEEAVDETDDSVIAFDNDVMGELEAIPTTKSTIAEKIEFIFQYLALRRTATNTLETMYKDDNTTALGTSTMADDGSVLDKEKVN